MKILTNKDIKIFFTAILCISGVFIFLFQFLTCTSWKLPVLLLSLLHGLCILGVCFFYFHRQNKILEEAVGQINLYLSGDRDVRIACHKEGSLYKLFHAVNTLAAALSAQGEREQKMKEFLKGTISDISHQLKTPLAALRIYNELFQGETDHVAAVKEFAGKSEKEIERIDMLVQNLLKITRLDAGAVIINRKPENLSHIMTDIYQHFEFRMYEEQKMLTLSGADNILLDCDRNWIIEAISNMVKNSLDHTGPGGQIAIEWRKYPDITQIMIRDNGSGIHPEDLYHIFKRFYRSRFSKDTQGIGLGLSLAKTIIEAHDGNITVDSVLGKGSLFVVTFVNLTEM